VTKVSRKLWQGIGLAWLWLPAILQAGVAEDAPLKAAFVFNFVKFTQWPQLSEQQPLQLCLLNLETSMLPAFDAMAGRRIGLHAIALRHVSAQDQLASCQLLYIHDLPPKVLNVAVLTVGSHRQFLELGGMIRLYEHQGRLQFDVNLASTQRVGIKLSAQLLKLAHNLRGTL